MQWVQQDWGALVGGKVCGAEGGTVGVVVGGVVSGAVSGAVVGVLGGTVEWAVGYGRYSGSYGWICSGQVCGSTWQFSLSIREPSYFT